MRASRGAQIYRESCWVAFVIIRQAENMPSTLQACVRLTSHTPCTKQVLQFRYGLIYRVSYLRQLAGLASWETTCRLQRRGISPLDHVALTLEVSLGVLRWCKQRFWCLSDGTCSTGDFNSPPICHGHKTELWEMNAR